MHAMQLLEHSVLLQLLLLLMPDHLPVDLVVSIYILHVTKESLQVPPKQAPTLCRVSSQLKLEDMMHTMHMYMPCKCVYSSCHTTFTIGSCMLCTPPSSWHLLFPHLPHHATQAMTCNRSRQQIHSV
jgi:hypothetical protein